VSQTQSNLDATYAAGFFDGEGCVAIRKRTDPLQYQLVAIVGNTDKGVLEWWVERFGGSLYTKKADARPKHRQMFVWETRSKKAATFLEQIRPYVRVKGNQIDAALEFQRTIGSNNRPVPDHVIAQREMFYQAMKGMKRESDYAVAAG
jgi:hypothetical protein